MGDRFYRTVHAIGSAIFWGTSRPRVLHVERTDRGGAWLLASSHHSPFDVPLLMRHSRRRLDFLSIVELFQYRFIRWFYGSMNAFAIDRAQADPATVRVILERLRQGRVVAMFPEGRIVPPPRSVTHGGRFRSGIVRLARLADVPIIPAVVIGSGQYRSSVAWLPLKRIRYGVIFGTPIEVRRDLEEPAAMAEAEERLGQAFVSLYQELNQSMEDSAASAAGEANR